MNDKKHLNSLARGLEALSILNTKDRLTGSELARHLDIPRTTAHRILETLAHEGYVLHDVANRCFRLSKKIRHIALGFNRSSLLAEVARPALRALSNDTLMPVGLTTPVGPQMVTQVATDHDAPLALERVKEGATFSLALGASGHVYLAHCSKEVRSKLLAAASRAGTGESTARAPSDAEFDRIREVGYAFSPARHGWPEGLIAVPVFSDGEYVASVHLRYMRRVMTEENVIQRLLPKVRETAQQISVMLAAALSEAPDQRPFGNDRIG